ncbi:hypothetical protein B0H16DRAFT_1519168 [Mycena metata]|uniref:Uncharacterized protein n=1 Tax=Mycena metata TaxID=1033252 RepID=A0AAD7JMU2_9AGAR|nr:hypothetical protein B0H16DRAFT_1519168 [Mycena metata]
MCIGPQSAELRAWSNTAPATMPARIPRPSPLPLRKTSKSSAPEVALAVLEGVLVTVAMSFCASAHVERTTEPSCVALKCAVTQLDQRNVVDEESVVEPVSAVNLSPALYPHAGMELSFRARRTPPRRVQQVDTAVSLLAQHPGALGMVVVAFVANSNFSLLMVVLRSTSEYEGWASAQPVWFYIPREFCRQRV